MAHPIMRPHTEPRLCRGSPLFFGGQPDSGLDHPTTLPRRLGLPGGHQTLRLRLVWKIHGRIRRSGNGDFISSGHARYCGPEADFIFWTQVKNTKVWRCIAASEKTNEIQL